MYLRKESRKQKTKNRKQNTKNITAEAEKKDFKNLDKGSCYDNQSRN